MYEMRLLTAMDGHGWSVCSANMQKGTKKAPGTPQTFFPCLPSLPRLFPRGIGAADGPGLVFGVCFRFCYWLIFISRIAVVQSCEPDLRNSSLLARLASLPPSCSWVPRTLTPHSLFDSDAFEGKKSSPVCA